jgi:hypothetical protein
VAQASDLDLSDRIAAAERVLVALTQPTPVDYLTRLQAAVNAVNLTSLSQGDREAFLSLVSAAAKVTQRPAKRQYILRKALDLIGRKLE